MRFFSRHGIFFCLAFSCFLIAASRSKLDQQTASTRARLVSDVHYDLFFDLTEEKHFSGRVQINFQLRKKDKTHIDFTDGLIRQLKVNGQTVRNFSYDGSRVLLDLGLRKGANRVTIDFKHKYSHTGAGLHRFKDPTDNLTYVYSNFEPFAANQMFPSFDQPDLKASYSLEVKAPEDWQVISSTLPKSSHKEDKWKVWVFPQSSVFSTYIFSLHAGPFKVWKDRYEDIPLRLFARQSLAKHVRYEDWFSFTKQGFSFFNRYFEFPYPFGKYDQVIVPEFNAGAMENVAAVTFSERYLSRSHPSEGNRFRLANTIFHEMAHMWFGNLVTMKWWDDLWLNESFATYMAHKGLATSSRFKNAWKAFSRSAKSWAYWNDGLVVTHPIQGVIPSTEHAFSSFDGITYGKGASFLKQLNFFAGEDAFRKGLVSYFKDHAYKNTTLEDFVSAIDAQTKRDLKKFTSSWLTTAGTNTLSVDAICRGDSVKLSLKQEAPKEHPELRKHRTRIGLYYLNEDRVELGKSLDVTYDHRPKSIEVDKIKCPDLIFGNQDDFDFVHLVLDQKSLEFLKHHFSKIQDEQVKIILWQELWEMVLSDKISLSEYIDLVLNHLPKEEDLDIYSSFKNRYESIFEYLYAKPSSKQAQSQVAKITEMMWSVAHSDRSEDVRNSMFKFYVKFARGAEDQGRFLKILGQKGDSYQGLKLDDDIRWNLILALQEMDYPKSMKLAEGLHKTDQSDRAKKKLLQIQVAGTDLKAKKLWFEKVLAQKGLTIADQKAILHALIPYNQQTLRKDLMPDYYKSMPKVLPQLSVEIASLVAESLVPFSCKMSDRQTLVHFIESHELSDDVEKALKIAGQENERCARVSRFY